MKSRIVLFFAMAATAALAWSLPAVAHTSSVKATSAVKVTKIKVTAGKPSEFKFKLSASSAKAGVVTFVVTNGGAVPHDFKIAGKKTKLLNPKQSAKLTVTFKKAGKYPYLCTVSGHAAAGMKGTFTVK
jgi:uncharacterized cupredoxin-like copper-binding protein